MAERCTIEDWAAKGRFFTWEGRRVFFREYGSGEPLLLVHRLPTASWNWHRVWPALADRYRVIAPDLLGFGLSDKPKRCTYTVMRQADLCRALLDNVGVDAFHILAEDYGDTVAQELLSRDRDGAVASICFLNGGLFPEAHRLPPVQRLLTSPVGRPLARFVIRRPFQRSLSRLFGPETRPDAHTLDALWRLLIHNCGRRVMPRLMAYRDDRRKHRDRWANAMADARVPLRLIWGTADPVCGPETAAIWRQRVPGGDIVELPGIGHFPALEAPEAVAGSYIGFRTGPVQECCRRT